MKKEIPKRKRRKKKRKRPRRVINTIKRNMIRTAVKGMMKGRKMEHRSLNIKLMKEEYQGKTGIEICELIKEMFVMRRK